jgi:hypothetical protein
MIQDDGIVSTGAGTHSPHPLQVTAKSQKRAGGSTNIELSIGEQKAKCPQRSRSAFGTCRRTAVPGLQVTQPEPGRLGISPMHPEHSLSDSA